MLNFVCVCKKGGKVGYDETWVHKLQNAVKRNTTVDHKFYALTDCNVSCNKIPLETMPLWDGKDAKAWWNKIQLFKHEEFVNTKTVYFDLDVLIIENIDNEIEKLIVNNKFTMVLEHTKAVKTSNSSIMYWNGDYRYLYKEFMKNPNHYYKKHSTDKSSMGDQGFIQENTDHSLLQDIIGDSSISWTKDLNNIKKDTKFVIFTKNKHKPSTYLEHPIVKRNWI